MFADYSGEPGGGDRLLPHVVMISIDPVARAAPARTAPLDVMVTIHEEGTSLAWRRMATVTHAQQEELLKKTADLHLWSAGMGLTRTQAKRTATELGRDLHRVFLGDHGAEMLTALTPTAVLVQVDETLTSLPWELMQTADSKLSLDTPFGRVVTTGAVPRAKRDPVAEDPILRILVVANPTDDLAATAAECNAISSLEGSLDGVTIEVRVLEGAKATTKALARAVKGQDYDMLHFAGHASFDVADPHTSALRMADGPLTADAVGLLPWRVPPYIVFNSACESARTAAGRRLQSPRGHANGLAAAFMLSGSEAYLGHYWPVGDQSAGNFAASFYSSLVHRRNVGNAVMDARGDARQRFETESDLTAFGAVYFGDPGTAERRDVASMAS
ncbi:MAG: CHAT domain-containing protein [Propionicimonas sp.]